MDKEYIISEIKRTAMNNGGNPLSSDHFYDETGIRKNDWEGKHWIRLSDAVMEAGFKPNQFGQAAFDEIWLIKQLINYIREIEHFPTKAELKMKKFNDPEFPNNVSIRNHLGTKPIMIKKIFDFCKTNDGFNDILEICLPELKKIKINTVENIVDSNEKYGHIYLLKHDKVYKIGKSTDVTRRYKKIQTQMPYKMEEVHVIETDDPSGIEAYWHNRFKDKRQNGEWFKLSASDIKAFKKRRFM